MSKFIMDSVWGEIEVTPFALQFLDCYPMQRMRFMKQLGPCNFVYTCAEHSRFAHSLGVYHLARRMALSLRHKHPNVVTEMDVDSISVAGLVHDIGHGPFSHSFDKITNTRHEVRSIQILGKIVEDQGISGVGSVRLEEMGNMIDPPEHLKNHWKYQIVSNSVADVDRMDYLVRDSQNAGVGIPFTAKSALRLIDSATINGAMSIQYPVAYLIEDLQYSRSYMYSRVYLHKTAKKIEDILAVSLAGRFKESLSSLDSFLWITDAILQEEYQMTGDENIVKIFNRKLSPKP